MTIVHVTRWPLITQVLAIALVAFLGLDGFLLVKGLRAHSNTVAVDVPVVSPASPVATRELEYSGPARDSVVRTPVARATPAEPTRTAPPTPTPGRAAKATATAPVTSSVAAATPAPPARARKVAIALTSADPSAPVSPARVRRRSWSRLPAAPVDARPVDAPEYPRPILVGTIMKQGGELALMEFPDGHTRLLRIGEQVGDLILRSVTTGEAVFSTTEGGRITLRTAPTETTP